MISLLWLIPALPFVSATLLILFGSRLSRRAVAALGVGSIGLSALVTAAGRGQLCNCPSGRQRLHTGSLDLDQCRGLPAADRTVSGCALARDGSGGYVCWLPDPYLCRRVHDRRRELQPLLRLHEPVRRVDAHAAARKQPSPPLTRMGRCGLVQLSADRLLVPRSGKRAGGPQGVHRNPRRRLRHDGRIVLAVHAAGHAADSGPDAARFPAVALGIHLRACGGSFAPGRCGGQIGADSVAGMVARCDGRPDANQRADPRGDDGDGGRLSDSAHARSLLPRSSRAVGRCSCRCGHPVACRI